MNSTTYRALVVREVQKGQFTCTVEECQLNDLPDNEVLIHVAYSSLNYKDALSATGNRAVTRSYPHTPGVDAAGTVVESSSQDFTAGDEVIVMGYDLGMNTPGGYGEFIRVPANWIVPLPAGLTLRESMIYGTAGFTAAMSVQRLQSHGVTPEQGEILVTGATGGVGSVAVAMLAAEGFEVVAATGKSEAAEFLSQLGATSVIDRSEAIDTSSRPMLRTRWAGVVDTVGGEMLTTALASTHYGGCVTCCGLVASPNLTTTVFPFILRGVTLAGIDSVECDIAFKRSIWNKIAAEWKLDTLPNLAREVSIDELDVEFERILAGKQQGRVLVCVS